MQKRKKLAIILLAIIILLTPVALMGTSYMIEIQRGRQDIMGLERREREAYVRLNYAFLWGEAIVDTELLDSWNEWYIEWSASYRPFGAEYGRGLNDFEINDAVYLALKMYELETGNVVTWEIVADYHSQEFEPDGTRRLYNNGNHPEIQAFVDWMVEGSHGGGRPHNMSAWQFIGRIEYMYFEYIRANEEFERPPYDLIDLSPQMLDALVRAYADPNYVLDLTSLQQAGY